MKQVCILYNPIAGKGLGLKIAKQVASFLKPRGIATSLIRSDKVLEDPDMQELIRSTQAVIIAGGDGTLMHFLPILKDSAAPVYMLPTGTESLFAREFMMSRKAPDVFSALESGKISEHHLPTVNGHYFFSMVSLGFDSQVVKELSDSRRGPIRYSHYVLAGLKCAWHHRAPCLRLKVDGETVLEDKSGFLIIANNSQYALGAQFVPEADSSHRELCARFFPCTTVLGHISWSLGCLIRKASCFKKPLFFCGQHFEVECLDQIPYPAQADGEDACLTPLDIRATASVLRVLS